MQIQGMAQIHSAQPITSRIDRRWSKHRRQRCPFARRPIGHFTRSRPRQPVQDIPAIRQDRVAEIRAQIASGVYETDDKLDGP